jgi:hypothetical protein
MADVATPQAEQQLQLDAEGLDRGVGFLGLLWASEGSIIGSGWLFGALAAWRYEAHPNVAPAKLPNA